LAGTRLAGKKDPGLSSGFRGIRGGKPEIFSSQNTNNKTLIAGLGEWEGCF